MSTEEDIGKQLARYRVEKSLRQADVAKTLGVTQQTVANWESGKPPKGARLVQLRAYLAGVDDMVGDVPPVKVERPLFFGHENTMRRVREIEHEFVEALPAALQPHTQAVVPFAGYNWRPDYLSAKVCADLKVIETSLKHESGMIGFAVETSLLTLSTIRAIHRQTGTEREAYSLLLVGPHPGGRWGNAKLQSAASAHGITIYSLPDQFAAAALVADLEYGPIE